jgi:uncharacterized protein YneF (UPF0154 family)
MSRRTLHLSLVGLALCLGAFLFTQNYAIVRIASGSACAERPRVNELLAARMLLTRMGARVPGEQ